MDQKDTPMYSRISTHSTSDHYSIGRNVSLAKSLSKPFITGDLYGEQESRTFMDHDGDNLEDMYLEEIVHTGEKMYSHKPKRDKNIRAKLGFLDLILYDLKVRYRRWKNKHWELPLFKAKIKNIESNFGSGIGSLFVFTRWVFCLNIILSILWFGMVVLPTAVTYNYSNITQPFAFKNLVDGQGAVSQLWLFYGSYRDTLQEGQYHIALAYLSMVLLTYFGSLFIIFKSLADARQPKSSTSVEHRFRFSMLALASWDHSITSSEASVNLSKGITSVLKDNLYEAKAKAESKKRSKREKYKVYALRVLAWFITIILIGGGCTAIAMLVVYVNFVDASPGSEGSTKESGDFFSVYGTTIIFSLINILVPLSISKLPRIEHYDSGKTELRMTLFRIFFLRMANLIALIISLYSNVNQMTYGCIGTVIGQEFYKLVVMDTLVHACVQLAMSFGKLFWSRQKAEFNISAAVLVLIYRQGLVWVGTIACPVLPLIGVLSNVVFFYLNYIIVQRTCKPPMKRWNQSRNTSFLMGYLLVTLVTIILPVSVVIGSHDIIMLGQHSVGGKVCGPFGASKPTSAYSNFAREQAYWLQICFIWLVSDTVLIPVFLIILSLLYYQRTLLKGLGQHKLMLQAELHQEREDNQKLLKKIQNM